jgi:hypothetical protein
MPHYFFPATKAAAEQVTELFDFVWPTAAALWNLRWQVSGFLNEAPDSTPKQLNDRFVFGSGIHGTNLRKSCIDTTWDSQKHHLAGIMLTNAFSIYEHWADEILVSVGMGDGKGKLLQRDTGSKGEPGLCETVNSLCKAECAVLKSAYYPFFSSGSKYSWPNIKNQLACFRYFKELRNSQIHNGGKATARAEAAYLLFAPISGKHDLGVRGELVHEPVVQGQYFRLHLRGVVGFCDILLRMMTTVDAELCRAAAAETTLTNAFKTGARLISTFSTNHKSRHMQVLGSCKRAGLPPPSDARAIEKFLLEKRLVSR